MDFMSYICDLAMCEKPDRVCSNSWRFVNAPKKYLQLTQKRILSY